MTTAPKLAETYSETVVPAETNVCVLGLGYIGLPTASVLATKGFHVYGTDVRADVVETINDGRIHIEEPDLDMVVVLTGGNYATHEPVQEILTRHILPAVQ